MRPYEIKPFRSEYFAASFSVDFQKMLGSHLTRKNTADDGELVRESTLQIPDNTEQRHHSTALDSRSCHNSMKYFMTLMMYLKTKRLQFKTTHKNFPKHTYLALHNSINKKQIAVPLHLGTFLFAKFTENKVFDVSLPESHI